MARSLDWTALGPHAPIQWFGHIRLTYVARSDMICDQFDYLSVIRGHHIYKDFLHSSSERHFEAEEKSMIVLLWLLLEMILSLDMSLEPSV